MITEFFDIRTLSLVIGGMMLVSTFSMGCYWFNRKTYGNFKRWTIGMGCLCAGFILFSFRGMIPDLLSIVLANALILLAFAMFYLGFKVLTSPSERIGLHLTVVMMLSFGVIPVLTYWLPVLSLRTTVVTITGAFYLALCLYQIIIGIKSIHYRNNLLLVSLLFVTILTLGALGIVSLFSHGMPAEFMKSGPYQGVPLFIIAIVQIAFVMGLLQLNSQLLEIDLDKNEERYRQLVEDSLQGLVIATGQPMQLVFVSSPMTHIIGYTPDELQRFTPEQLNHIIHPEDRGQFSRNFKNRLAGMAVSPVQQYRIRHKSGAYRWVETYTTLVKYDGQPAVHSHFLDITEKKQAEDINAAMFKILGAVTTARNLNDLFQIIHESLSPVIDVTNFFIALKDPQTNDLYFPYHVDTTDDNFSPIPFEDAENTSLTGLVFSKKEPILLNRNQLIEKEAQKGIWGPLPVIWMGVPLIVKDKVIGVVAVQSYTDPDLYTSKDLEVLTAVSNQMALAIERKQAQDALMESEQRYRHLFSHAPAGICEVDFVNQRFIRANEIICKFSGYARAELMRMNPLEFLTQKSRERFKERIARLAAGEKKTRNIEYELITKQGKQLSVAVTLDFAHDDKKLSHTLVVIHDISWRKRIEKEKIKAQKLLGEQQKLALIGQVAGKMAHDFNNILGVIMGNVELMLMDYDDPDIRIILKRILDHTEKGQYLTRNLIAFARNQEPRQKYFSFNEKIDLALALMTKDLNGIQIYRSYAADLPEVLADPGMIEHALINLLQNSIHAVSKTRAPEIHLHTFIHDDCICLEIKDNGCGIPEAHINDIFTPSFTLKGGKDLIGAYTSGIKGTGYGMSNIQKYVHQHKGTIEVTSIPDHGTSVRICFPVIDKQLSEAEKKSLSSVMVRPGMRILVVEDEPDISRMQHRVLSQDPCSHHVDVAVDGRSAIDLFDRHHYDLVSLDYILPGSLNGMDVYRHIRLNTTAIPILFVSGNIEFIEEIKSLTERDRQVGHLSKPCRGAEYVEAIHSLLS